MRTYSRSSQEKMNATGGEAPVLLLEITHPDLSAPIRVVNDNQDLTSNGNTFVGWGSNRCLTGARPSENSPTTRRTGRKPR